MNTLIENIANLFKVKTIITIAFTIAMIYCYIRGQISNEVFVSLASSVVTYYFTKNVSRETAAETTDAGELRGEAQSPESDLASEYESDTATVKSEESGKTGEYNASEDDIEKLQ